MAADTPDDAPTSSPPSPFPPDPADVEREMRDAEDLALAASGLGSGLLARQAAPETVAVLKVCPQCGNEYETAARFCPLDGTALRPKGSDSLVGRVLADRYHILKRIGEGGMGRVYLGEHVKMNRQCAIKVMSPALVNDHDSAARFAREASSAARIIHPNVAAVFDYGESDGLVYLVMEYVEGEPLSRILAREAPLAVERTLELGRQIAEGLGAAHELGIVHRDLKPDNILVARTRAGREVAKVVDFGIAKAMQETAGESLTRTGLVIGTPEFMSPEQLLGDPIDARSDLYALGCILHLMLTASPPFAAPTREQMIKRRLTEDAPHIQAVDPGLSDSLDRVVQRLLARSPVDRYGSAAEVRDALSGTHARRLDADGNERVGSPTPRSAPTLAFEAVVAPTQIAASSERAVTTSGVSRRRRARWPSYVLGTVLVVGGGLVVRSARGGSVPTIPGETTAVAPRPAAVVQTPAATPHAMIPAATTPVLPRADSTPVRPVVVVDSAALRKRRQDSLARAGQVDPRSVVAPIQRYAKAIESGSSEQLRIVFPNLPEDQIDYWRRGIFTNGRDIKAAVTYGQMPITRNKNTAELDFTLVVSYALPSSNERQILPRRRQRASLRRMKDGRWQIASLSLRP